MNGFAELAGFTLALAGTSVAPGARMLSKKSLFVVFALALALALGRWCWRSEAGDEPVLAVMARAYLVTVSPANPHRLPALSPPLPGNAFDDYREARRTRDPEPLAAALLRAARHTHAISSYDRPPILWGSISMRRALDAADDAHTRGQSATAARIAIAVLQLDADLAYADPDLYLAQSAIQRPRTVRALQRYVTGPLSTADRRHVAAALARLVWSMPSTTELVARWPSTTVARWLAMDLAGVELDEHARAHRRRRVAAYLRLAAVPPTALISAGAQSRCDQLLAPYDRCPPLHRIASDRARDDATLAALAADLAH